MSMVHISYGMKTPRVTSPPLRVAAILAGLAQATLAGKSPTRWQKLRRQLRPHPPTRWKKRARRLRGLQQPCPPPARLSQSHQPARRGSASSTPHRVRAGVLGARRCPTDVDPGQGRLIARDGPLARPVSTPRSTPTTTATAGLKGLRTVVFMNENDMRDRGLEEFGLVDRHELLERRDRAEGVRLPGGALRDSSRFAQPATCRS